MEYLVTNGADPLICDERRHNTCLHFASLYGHSDCVNKLLGSRIVDQVQEWFMIGDGLSPQGEDRQTVGQVLCDAGRGGGWDAERW